MGRPRTLTGAVCFLEPFAGGSAAVHVKVEDISRADAAAVLVAECVISLHEPLPAGGRVPFSVTVDDVVDTAHYAVRAHVDCTGSGDITEGDRISTVSYPVLTRGHPDRVEVEVRKI